MLHTGRKIPCIFCTALAGHSSEESHIPGAWHRPQEDRLAAAASPREPINQGPQWEWEPLRLLSKTHVSSSGPISHSKHKMGTGCVCIACTSPGDASDLGSYSGKCTPGFRSDLASLPPRTPFLTGLQTSSPGLVGIFHKRCFMPLPPPPLR